MKKQIVVVVFFVGSFLKSFADISISSGDPCGGTWVYPPYPGLPYQIDQGSYSCTFDQIQSPVKEQKAVASGSIEPNPCNESSPVSKTVSTSSGTVSVNSWEVSGSISYGDFGVTAKTGNSEQISYGSGCSVTINNWCQWAQPKAGIQHDEETKVYTCSYDNSTVTGIKKYNFQSYCDADGGNTPNCKTTCD